PESERLEDRTGRGVVHSARFRAHLERHERAAVQEIDSGPVPARGFGGEVGARPFVVEPPGAPCVAAVYPAGDVELGPAVVVARFLRSIALPAEARLSLQDRLTIGKQSELEVEIARGDLRAI